MCENGHVYSLMMLQTQIFKVEPNSNRTYSIYNEPKLNRISIFNEPIFYSNSNPSFIKNSKDLNLKNLNTGLI